VSFEKNALPQNTSVFIGSGVRVEGKIVQESKDEVVVIAGTFAGDIVSEGRVLIEEGGSVEAANQVRCFDMQVRGAIIGSGVIMECGLLRP